MNRFGCLIIVAVLVGYACGPGRCIHPRELTYKVKRVSDLEEGAQGKIDFHIVNKSDQFMLVERIAGNQIAPTGRDSLVGSQYGALSRMPDENGWHYNPLAQQETPPLFAYGLIPPGQRLRIEVELLPVSTDGTFEVHYRGFSIDEVAQFIFFPPRDENNMAGAKFERLTAEALGQVQARAEDGSDRADMFKVVVLDPSLIEARADCLVKMPYRIALKRARLDIDLQKELGEEPRWKLYSNALSGWVAGTSKGVVLLDGKKTASLPDSPPAFYIDVDRQEKLRIKLCDQGEECTRDSIAQPGPGRQFLWDFAALYSGDGKYTVGTFMDVNQRNAVTFLRLLKNNGCRLIMTYYFMESYYFEVKCEE